MALEKITSIRGTGVPVMGDDIDTDRIIPARFMKCVTFDGLGEFAFYDAKREAESHDQVYPFGAPKFASASILLSGANFGCGSSREHAPQSLYRAGIRAILAESFAEIFFGNSITLGMPCCTLQRDKLNELASMVNQEPDMQLLIDVKKLVLVAGNWSAGLGLPTSAQMALLEGKWDPIAELIESRTEVTERACTLSYISGY